MSGAPLASSTGHLRVRDCPGGTRCARRVSGLMMTSPGRPSGARSGSSWVLGSFSENITTLLMLASAYLLLQFVAICTSSAGPAAGRANVSTSIGHTVTQIPQPMQELLALVI